jgi:hypothetical protein
MFVQAKAFHVYIPRGKCIPFIYRPQELDTILVHFNFRLAHHVPQIIPSTIKRTLSLEGTGLNILNKALCINRMESYIAHTRSLQQTIYGDIF